MNLSKIITHLRRFSKISIGLILVSTIITIKICGWQSYIQLDFLHRHLENIDAYLNTHYFSAIGIYLLTFIGASVLSLPGSSVFLTTAGLFFNPLMGAFIAVTGGTLGATLLFLISRYLIGDSIQKRFAAQLAHINNELAIHGSYYLLIMRILSFLPFCVINILSGCTLIRCTTFLWTTALGITPAAVIYSLIGSHIRSAPTLDMLLTPYTVFLFCIFYGLKVVVLIALYMQTRKSPTPALAQR